LLIRLTSHISHLTTNISYLTTNMFKYLNTINSPADLKQLPKEALPVLCKELRDFIVEELSHNPGHLASSLGAVEITVALHYVFDTPDDNIVWDVGHQAYAHKILTGRREAFHTNRQYKGLAPFPTPLESEYDSFVCGHASNSISAALGMQIASQLLDEHRRTVAVIGDGAMTGGLAFEGLNNASMHKNNLLILLNDNQMAIDPIKGGFTKYLVDITTSTTYNKVRYYTYQLLKKMHLITENGRKRILHFNNSLKTNKQPNNIFRGLNIRYFGPVDGHDVLSLVRILSEIKDYKGPKVLHTLTVKGWGYGPAQNSATEWHAPGEFDVKTGERHVFTEEGQPPLYQEVFGKTLLELAKKNDKIVGITPAMPSGCSMNIMQAELPQRVFDVGIAEGHAVTFAAGLAKQGMIPYCNVYSSFLQRAYDNIIHDVAILSLPVVLCIDRAGIVGADGMTHHGLFDLAYLRPIPNLTIAAPMNEPELRNMLYTAQLAPNGPIAIRYPRGRGVTSDWKCDFEQIPIGKGRLIDKYQAKNSEACKAAVLSIGAIGNVMKDALIEIVEHDDCPYSEISHYDMRFLKPLDHQVLDAVSQYFDIVFTVEDGVVTGGFGSAVLEYLVENGFKGKIVRLGVPDEFVEHGSTKELYHALELDKQGLIRRLLMERGQATPLQ